MHIFSARYATQYIYSIAARETQLIFSLNDLGFIQSSVLRFFGTNVPWHVTTSIVTRAFWLPAPVSVCAANCGNLTPHPVGTAGIARQDSAGRSVVHAPRGSSSSNSRVGTRPKTCRVQRRVIPSLSGEARGSSRSKYFLVLFPVTGSYQYTAVVVSENNTTAVELLIGDFVL